MSWVNYEPSMALRAMEGESIQPEPLGSGWMALDPLQGSRARSMLLQAAWTETKKVEDFLCTTPLHLW